jgi:hypothetical protein
MQHSIIPMVGYSVEPVYGSKIVSSPDKCILSEVFGSLGFATLGSAAKPHHMLSKSSQGSKDTTSGPPSIVAVRLSRVEID